MPLSLRSKALFILTELVAFGLYYGFLAAVHNTPESGGLYTLYLIIVPVLIGVTILQDTEIRNVLIGCLTRKDWIIFVAALFVWGYLFALHGFSPLYMFYELAFIDEFNFRFLVPTVLSHYISREMSVLVQALLFTALYANYIVFEPAAYPGLYAPLYLISIFAMGIIYGTVAYLRRNFYLDLVIHQSLYDIIYFSPPIPGWIAYSFLPT